MVNTSTNQLIPLRVLLKRKAEDALFSLLDLDPKDKVDKVKLKSEKNVIWGKIELLVIELLPNVVRRKYKFKLPVHQIHPLSMLCALKAPQNLIKAAYKLCTVAANDAFALGCVFDDGADLDVLKLLFDADPGVVRYEHCKFKNLPLHMVCRKSTDLSTIEFLHEAYPAALEHKNANGYLPLHYACLWSSLPVVKYFIGKSKLTSVQAENVFNATPLHLAFRNPHREVAEFVAETYPEFLKLTRAHDGWSVLHYVCAVGNSMVGIEVLLHHYPDAVKLKDKMGRLPLALACKNPDFDEELLALLVRYYPDSIEAEDTDGNPVIDFATSKKLTKRMANEMGKPPAKKQKT